MKGVTLCLQEKREKECSENNYLYGQWNDNRLYICQKRSVVLTRQSCPIRKMMTTNGFFLEMLTFFRKMTSSNEARDSILDVDDDDDGQS